MRAFLNISLRSTHKQTNEQLTVALNLLYNAMQYMFKQLN